MASTRSDDGTRISFESFGTGSLPVLLLHGWGGSAAYWREMISHLDLAGLQVTALSYRGHGDSEKPATGYTFPQFANDVLAVADAVRARQFALVGFSMSGKFAQYIAAAHPERVLGMALIGPVPASEFSVPEEIGTAWCDSQQDRHAAFLRVLAPFVHLSIKPELIEAFLDNFQKADRVALEATLAMCAESVVDQARRIHTPALVLAGSFDPLLTPNLLRDTILAQIPRARMIKLPCGHEMPLEMPEQTATLVEAFLSGLTQAAVAAARA